MVPTIASSGSSFKGAAAYYLHDKDAETCDRIAWTHTENLPTDNADKAWKVMAWTALHQATLKASAGVRATGRKLEKPVFAFSVSWHPDQKPDKAHMLATAKAAATALGLDGYQAVFVSHNDEPHLHVHVMVNRVHPEHGKAATLSRSKAKLQAWALAYEKEHGKVYCPARENNARARAERKPERDRNPVIQAAWRQSDSGRSFQAALRAQGYELAQGNRRFVVVDRWGKALNPVRHLPDVRAAAFKDRLNDVDLANLPTAAAAQKAVKTRERKAYHAQKRYEAWSAEYLNKNQDRQLEERATRFNHYADALARKKDELAKFYKTAEKAAAIAALQKRVEHPSLVRRLTGAAKKDREELHARQRSFADAERRTAEQLGAITTERDFAMADMVDRHARENELARAYVAERKPSFYAEEKKTEQEQERPGRSGGRSRDEDGGRERVYHRTPPSPLTYL